MPKWLQFRQYDFKCIEDSILVIILECYSWTSSSWLTIDRDDGGGNGGNVDMILCTAQGAQVEGGVDPTGGNEIL